MRAAAAAEPPSARAPPEVVASSACRQSRPRVVSRQPVGVGLLESVECAWAERDCSSPSRSVYHSTADPPRAHARHGTLRARRLDGTLGQCAALAVRAPLRQRDGCMSLRLRWCAGRMLHPPGRLLYTEWLRCRCLDSSRATDTVMHHRLGTASRKAICRPVSPRQRSRRRAADVSPALRHERPARWRRERGTARPSGGCARQGRARRPPPSARRCFGFRAAESLAGRGGACRCRRGSTLISKHGR